MTVPELQVGMIEEDLISAMPESKLQRPLNRQVAKASTEYTYSHTEDVFGRGKEGEKGKGSTGIGVYKNVR